MNRSFKLAIDTSGLDKGEDELIKGAALALEKNPKLHILLVGDKEYLSERAAGLNMPSERTEILHAPDKITNYDNPAEAVFKKTESSMLRALSALSEKEELFGMITAGNTGVLMAGALRYLSAKNRVRPCLAATLPAADGSFTCLVDTGATVDCSAAMLVHFARLGSAFMRDTYGIEAPRVGLLSNGAEPTKGNKLVKEAHLLLSEAEGINFVGNIEGNIALSGSCDVLVCDGFAGNQVLKVSEGMAMRMMTDIAKYAKRTGSEEIMKLFGHLMAVYNFSALGGGIILGCDKPIVKIRGSAGADAVVSAADMLFNMSENRSIFDKEKNKI